ncbi:MAG: hypothetical protein KJ904_11765 [Alphaproteobacteria bacterium]|nr:hypothetical protein [Alphaproteobacteria bacterium]MBU0797771.1 hypothetical protein [Alphaproteobacteria bacterium]MBU0887833.1 hypothetical protein [Alphaproteobacteria bacterium]MBU1814944.1 hypothetical protein [Alphaproteobacteria bacterium]MBU2090288.1 hypothetical protein [Alphaproteobacteria bacterium]
MATASTDGSKSAIRPAPAKPTATQRAWLSKGLDQPGGKLPLFDSDGQRVNPQTIRACLDRGWAEPWFANPTKPDWLVCRLTEAGYLLFADKPRKSAITKS